MRNSNKKNSSVAIFIDGAWLYYATRRINKNIDYSFFFNTLIKKFGKETTIYYYNVSDPTNKKQERFYISLKKIGYIVHNIPVRKLHNRIIDSGINVNLTVHAMRVLPSLEKFVLISGDNDFAILLREASRIKVDTCVIAIPFSTGYLLRQFANFFLNLETLVIEYKPNDLTKIKKIPKQNYIEKGDHLNSYILLRDLMMSAKNNITIIDQYINDQIITMIKLLKNQIRLTIITDPKKISPADFFIQIEKLKKEGFLINIYKNTTKHDRFIGIDNVWWHSGASFKDFGVKDSMFNKITDKSAKIKLNSGVAEVTKNSQKL